MGLLRQIYLFYLFIYTVLIERAIHNSMCSNALNEEQFNLILYAVIQSELIDIENVSNGVTF